MPNEKSDRELLIRIDERTEKLTAETTGIRQEIAEVRMETSKEITSLWDNMGKETTGIWEDVGDIKTDVAVTKTDIEWFKKFFWMFLAIMLGTFGTAVATLIKLLIKGS